MNNLFILHVIKHTTENQRRRRKIYTHILNHSHHVAFFYHKYFLSLEKNKKHLIISEK